LFVRCYTGEIAKATSTRDDYGSTCSGEAPRTGKERRKRLPDRLRKKANRKESQRHGQDNIRKQEGKGNKRNQVKNMITKKRSGWR
jgi:hypothetical protein